MAKRFLGYGQSSQYEHLLNSDEVFVEVGEEIYAVRYDFYCRFCNGVGCHCCKWTGEEDTRMRASTYPGEEIK